MPMHHPLGARLALTAAILGAPVLAKAPARADLKIVSEVEVTRSAPPSTTDENPSSLQSPAEGKQRAPHTVTTYYHGESARVEGSDGGVTIYDRAADKIYTLRPADKTYSAIALAKYLQQGSASTSRTASYGRQRLSTQIDLKKDTDTEKKTFAGQAAVRYSLTGSVSRQSGARGGFPRGGGRFPGGGFPRGRFPRGGFPGGGFPGGFPGMGQLPGGGFPGGGFPSGESEPGGGRSGRGARNTPTMQIEGEYWIAAAPRLDGKMKDPLLPSLAQTVPPGPFFSALCEKLAKIRGFPVASKVTVTTTSRRSETPTTVTTTTEMKSITEGALDGSLFKVPAGYKEVDSAPAAAPERSGDSRPAS